MMSRLDSQVVKLPVVNAEVVVVPDLEAVEAEVLIGMSLISSVGEVHIRYDGDAVSSVVFASEEPVSAVPDKPHVHEQTRCPSLCHVEVIEEPCGSVTLRANDGSVRWEASEKRWVLSWNWKDGPPDRPLGPGIGEYPRKKLTADQERLFQEEVEGWIQRGWQVKHCVETDGEPKGVLPLIAQEQEHKPTTPVRPCLDYCELNSRIQSFPGGDAPACDDKLRKWRRDGCPENFDLLDIRKAYLQVHVAEHLQPYQLVLWKSEVYKMTRMCYGLAVAPKFMDLIVKWILRQHPEFDNYVDDICVPKCITAKVAEKLDQYGMPTKTPEPLMSTRVLGLELTQRADGSIQWCRRSDVDLTVPVNVTRRHVFSWCGKVTSHYPVCGWLRPACSLLKRMASVVDGWDYPAPSEVRRCMVDVAAWLTDSDPTYGVWSADIQSSDVVEIHCDASDLAYGVVLVHKGEVLEDRSWLRPRDDKCHINNY